MDVFLINLIYKSFIRYTSKQSSYQNTLKDSLEHFFFTDMSLSLINVCQLKMEMSNGRALYGLRSMKPGILVLSSLLTRLMTAVMFMTYFNYTSLWPKIRIVSIWDFELLRGWSYVSSESVKALFCEDGVIVLGFKSQLTTAWHLTLG